MRHYSVFHFGPVGQVGRVGLVGAKPQSKAPYQTSQADPTYQTELKTAVAV